jgi:hypothetical protein
MTLKNAKIIGFFHRMECQALFARSRVLMDVYFPPLLSSLGSNGVSVRMLVCREVMCVNGRKVR